MVRIYPRTSWVNSATSRTLAGRKIPFFSLVALNYAFIEAKYVKIDPKIARGLEKVSSWQFSPRRCDNSLPHCLSVPEAHAQREVDSDGE